MKISKALWLSLRDLFHPKVLLLLLLTPLVSVLIWFSIFWFFAWEWAQKMRDYLVGSDIFLWVMNLIGVTDLGHIPLILAIVSLVALFLPLSYLTYVFFISTFVMNYLVDFVGQKSYPHLIRVRGGAWRAMGNSIFHSLMFILIFVLTLPLWLLPGMQVFLPIVLVASYNRRVFTYDVLSQYLPPPQIRDFQKRHKGSLFALGLVVAVLSYMPVLSLFAPLYGALVFTHAALSTLQDERR